MANVVDLFAGCGGLSLGAARAGLHPSLAVELDNHASAAHSKNFPQCKTAVLDLSKVESRDIGSLVGSKPDLVVGGPPCQGFSYIGKRDQNDPRNNLLDKFFEIVADIKPRAFMMENVPGLLDQSNQQFLEKAINRVADRYTILAPTVLDAADFGAATRRKRVIIVGYDSASVNRISLECIKNACSPSTTVREALAGLPEPNSTDIGKLELADTPYVRLINRTTESVGCQEKIQAFLNGFVSGLETTRHTDVVRERFRGTLPGQTEQTSRFFRLHPDQPARTLRAGTGADRGSFQSARPIHFLSPRVVTVREAARIQGFPDWFDFHPTKWHSHRMIGNSVSPIFAEAVLKVLADALGINTEQSRLFGDQIPTDAVA
ncbi:modification methylase NaeI [Phaeobacter inhibens]|uniref:Cytosine-specific methyltransferase n=1 Tax=Phaeobacter inhibens TaxID=221822 RepID=A0ABM6RIH4_9RHOB|nr:DNA cytosine methyltransferase [Phaeobacter inhibens]AUQ51675.1 modification methylase NaeI [Phaeobacter inhibens]AUQ96257.1 modification methylase NaeI [Phaeobacter inhibens]AUR21480.1 modification methylase NaeI [Phaeobacter inhibens]